jgi:hypothetical protein
LFAASTLIALILCGCAQTPIEGYPAASEDVADRSGDADATTPANESSGLEPRYQPREPEPKSWYNSTYIFGMTRGVAGSTIAPAGKAPLFVLTVPLDIVCLPFTLIGGLFG